MLIPAESTVSNVRCPDTELRHQPERGRAATISEKYTPASGTDTPSTEGWHECPNPNHALTRTELLNVCFSCQQISPCHTSGLHCSKNFSQNLQKWENLWTIVQANGNPHISHTKSRSPAVLVILLVIELV